MKIELKPVGENTGKHHNIVDMLPVLNDQLIMKRLKNDSLMARTMTTTALTVMGLDTLTDKIPQTELIRLQDKPVKLVPAENEPGYPPLLPLASWFPLELKCFVSDEVDIPNTPEFWENFPGNQRQSIEEVLFTLDAQMRYREDKQFIQDIEEAIAYREKKDPGKSFLKLSDLSLKAMPDLVHTETIIAPEGTVLPDTGTIKVIHADPEILPPGSFYMLPDRRRLGRVFELQCAETFYNNETGKIYFREMKGHKVFPNYFIYKVSI